MDFPLDLRSTFHEQWPSYGPAWNHAIELGVDIAELERNLRLTPEQRILQHQRALQLAEVFRTSVAHAKIR